MGNDSGIDTDDSSGASTPDSVSLTGESNEELSWIECLPTELLTQVLFPLPFSSRLNLRSCSHAMADAVALTDLYLTEPELVVGSVNGESDAVRVDFGKDFEINCGISDIPAVINVLSRLFQRIYCESVYVTDWTSTCTPDAPKARNDCILQKAVPSLLVELVDVLLSASTYHQLTMNVDEFDERTTQLLNDQAESKLLKLRVENVPASTAIHRFSRPVELVYDGGSSYESGFRLNDQHVLDLIREGHSLSNYFYVNIGSAATVVELFELIGSSAHQQSLDLVISQSIPESVLQLLKVRKECAEKGALFMQGKLVGCFDTSDFDFVFLRHNGVALETSNNFSSRTVKLGMRKGLRSDDDYISFLLSSFVN